MQAHQPADTQQPVLRTPSSSTQSSARTCTEQAYRPSRTWPRRASAAFSTLTLRCVPHPTALATPAHQHPVANPSNTARTGRQAHQGQPPYPLTHLHLPLAPIALRAPGAADGPGHRERRVAREPARGLDGRDRVRAHGRRLRRRGRQCRRRRGLPGPQKVHH